MTPVLHMLLEEIVIKGKLEDINVDIARVVKLLLYKSNFNIKCGFPEIIKEGKTNNLVLMVNERVYPFIPLHRDILKGYVWRVLQDMIIRTLVYRVERLFCYT